MTALSITAIGPASSVQDAGRPGSQRYGLTPGGAMDRLALATANALLGNPLFAAAIEIGPFGAAFTAHADIRLALTGAARPADIAGRPMALNRSFTLKAGENLTLGFARGGAFSYLAMAGGIAGEPMFGSLAVNARAGLGSPYPRPLQSGDMLAAASAAANTTEREIRLPVGGNEPIRVVMGPQDDEFDDEAKALFLDGEWAISATSDRMGYRLDGPAIKHLHGHNIVSDGTVNGSIQVPGNGAPIVLMPDRGTSGGYPKIATVISADLGRFAQTPVGHAFRFKAVTMAQAQADARAFDALLRSLPGRVQDLSDLQLDIDALHSANVAGAAVNATDARSWQSHPDASSHTDASP